MKRFAISIATVLLLFVATSSASAAPAVTLSATTLAPTASVTITGTGFDPSASVDVFLDTTDVALAVSKATGGVSYTFQLPASTQPGTHWITLDELRTHAAAQAAINVTTSWPQSGWGPSKRSFNPYENTIDTSNVSQLVRAWSQPLDGFGNSKPPIFYGRNVYVRDADQVIRAFSDAGKLLWTATTPFSSFPDSLTPAAGSSKVFFSDLNGNVIAYNFLCRTDGGTCTPAWTTNIGSRVQGGLTLYKNRLYAPAADGSVHVLNPVTGVQATPILVTSSGSLTSWIAFAADGAGYVAHGASMAATVNNGGGSSDDAYSGTLSFPVVGARTAYVTETDALVREVQLGWTQPLASSGCNSTPAYANGLVYAADCTSLGAYDAGTGSLVWTVTIPGQSQGLSVADGVLYGCINNRLIAYDASYGGRLWTGGSCTAAPIIVNGVVYASFVDLSAYTLNGAQTTSLAHRGIKRPDPRRLKPSAKLHRRHRHVRRHHTHAHGRHVRG